VLVGAGGAARAALVGLRDAGAASIVVAARRPAQAAVLTEALGGTPRALEGLSLEGATLVVQATSATLDASAGAELAAALRLEATAPEATVVDLVYAPRRTAVLAAAEAVGRRTVDGVGMLLHQGALALEAWTGQPAPLEAMRAALEASLGHSG
ncbi:MAG: shikimate dehydrogenase, partial [Myxococcota bacterium]